VAGRLSGAAGATHRHNVKERPPAVDTCHAAPVIAGSA